MSRTDKVVLCSISAHVLRSGTLRRLADQGVNLALVVPSNSSSDTLILLKTEMQSLQNAGKVTVHREDVDVAASFQSCLEDAMRAHGGLDVVVKADGKVIAKSWTAGNDDDRSQMLAYTAFTDAQAQRLRAMLQQSSSSK